MSKSVKWLLMVLVFSVLLVIAAMAYITLVFDPNTVRPQIEQAARDQGVSLRLNGPIQWQWYPRLGLSLEDVAIGAAGEEFAHIERLSSEVAIAPLFQGRVAIAGIHLQGAKLNLIEDAQGRANWESLTESKAAPMSKDPVTPAKQSQLLADNKAAEAPVAVDLAIDELQITDLQLRYDNQATGQQAQVSVPSCTLGGFNLSGSLFELECRTQVQFDAYPRVSVHSFGQMSFDSHKGVLTLVTFKQTLSLDEQTLSLTLAGTLNPEMGETNVDLELAPTNLKAWLTAMGIELPTMSKASALESVGLSAGLTVQPGQSYLQGIAMQVDGQSLRGDIIQDANKHLQITFQGDSLNLDDYLPPASEHTAQQQVPDSKNTSSASQQTPVAGPTARRLSAEKLDMGLLTGPSLSLDARLDAMQLSAIPMSNVVLKAQLSDGVLQVQALESTLYDGQLSANATLNAASKPALRLDARLTDVALQPLLERFADEKRLSGQSTVAINLNASGNSLAAWQQTAKGAVTLDAGALAVSELDIERDVCETAAILNRKPVPAIDWKGQTQLQDVSATLAINGQTVTLQAMKAGVEELSLVANGSSRYIEGDFDIKGAVRVTGDANPERACQIRDRWRHRDLPLRCRGNIDKPLSGRVCGPDSDRLDQLLKDEVKARAEEKIQEKLQDKLKDRLGEEGSKQVEQLLRGIFGR